MKTTLHLEVEYDPAVTDADSLAEAMDRLMETILSTPGILDEYGRPKVGEFLPPSAGQKWRTRLENNVGELRAAEADYGAGRNVGHAKTVLSAQRCRCCGNVLVPLFHVAGPYVCEFCVNDFRDRVACGQDVFGDYPKRVIEEKR
jgi:hypothetical protein